MIRAGCRAWVLGLALAAWAWAPAAPGHAGTPAIDYALHCQGCHLADGRETPGLVPALQGAVGRFVRVPDGRVYMMRLPNIASTPLSDAETAALLTWLVGRFGAAEAPADFVPFTAAEVAAVRRSPWIDVAGARRALVEQLER